MYAKFLLLFFLTLSGSLTPTAAQATEPLPELPWAAAGLTEYEAAAHLLDRLTYGARPGEVEGVVESGLENWLRDQLYLSSVWDGGLGEKYPATTMSLTELSRTYPGPGVRILTIARSMGESPEALRARPRPSRAMGAGDTTRTRSGGGQTALLNRLLNVEPSPVAEDDRRRKIQERFGFRPLEEYSYQLMAQKLERAIYGPDQVVEQLTDFWFNHFNVTITSVNEATPHVLSYERDAIRPYVLGDFRDMLGATARHPAMLLYLNNNRSNAADSASTLRPLPDRSWMKRSAASNNNGFGQQPGINENYARELFELHTLGVNGGYTQRDIEEAARAFTGWKMNPMTYPLPERAEQFFARLTNLPDFVVEEGFFFDPTRHDAGPKQILGESFPAGVGIAEGERVLDLAASHPATARQLAHKLAVRFVRDEPPADLVEAAAAAFTRSGGDLRQTLLALVYHEEFWRAKGEKIRTPLEYIAASVRALDGEVRDPRQLLQWCTRMGQPLYAFQAPTGYPDEAGHWTNGAGLLNRMNFGAALASGDVAGVEVDVHKLTEGETDTGSVNHLLTAYLPRLLPGRNTSETHELLRSVAETDSPAGIVGLILGSPEFQRQ